MRTVERKPMLDWQYHTSGYEVVPRPQTSGEKLLVVQPKASVPVHGYTLGPEHAGLFREFAALDQTPESVVSFAGRYGLLWQEYGSFELFEDQWLISIAMVQALVSEYDQAIAANDPEEKKQSFERIWELFNTDRIPIRFKLRMHPHRTLAIPNKCWTEPVPENLMSAIWLQIADQVSQGTQFKRCENCPSWFPVGPGTRTKPTKRFCSTRCRVAWHQGRRKS